MNIQEMQARHQGIMVAKDSRITVVGCGGIGSPTVIVLAKMGFKNIHVIDPDVVDTVNLGSQLYRIQDVGKAKVEALKEQVKEYAGIEITVEQARTDGSDITTEILVLAVDCIDARKEIVENATFTWLVDGRMGGQTYSVFCYPSVLKDEYLDEQIFPKEEADPTPCSEKAICYNTFGCASVVAATVKRINNQEESPKAVHFCYINNILDAEAL